MQAQPGNQAAPAQLGQAVAESLQGSRHRSGTQFQRSPVGKALRTDTAADREIRTAGLAYFEEVAKLGERRQCSRETLFQLNPGRGGIGA